MKKWMSGLAAVALAGLLAGCASGSAGEAEEIELFTPGMEFSQREIHLEKGKAYKILLQNTDMVEHDITVKGMTVKALKTGSRAHAHGGQKDPVHAHAEPGQSDWVSFTPTREGTYDFYCTIPGHKEAGMTGKIIVR